MQFPAFVSILTFLCRYKDAVVDLEAAQCLYVATGQLVKGNLLSGDVAKIKQLCLHKQNGL